MTEVARRVSDAELKELRAEFKKHVAEEHADRKEQHRIMMENAQAINALTVAVGDLTNTVTLHMKATAPLVEIHHELMSAARLGTRVGDFFIWLGKFGVAGGALVLAAHWVVEHFPKGH